PLEDASKIYKKIAVYSHAKNYKKQVFIENLRYDLTEIKTCQNFCIALFRDDFKNTIHVGFSLEEFQQKLTEIDGRVDIKGKVLKDRNGRYVLKIHELESSGGIDVYKIIGVE